MPSGNSWIPSWKVEKGVEFQFEVDVDGWVLCDVGWCWVVQVPPRSRFGRQLKESRGVGDM